MFEEISAYLAERGLLMRARKIVDGTIFAAPSSTKSAKGGRDPQMHQTKKESWWAKVEHPFHVVKNLFGHRKVLCRGLAKNGAQLFSRNQSAEQTQSLGLRVLWRTQLLLLTGNLRIFAVMSETFCPNGSYSAFS